jgi:outer membrane protein assembly factor BamD
MKIFLKLGLLVLIVLSIAGCSGYERALKSNDYRLKYREAMRYYNEADYTRSSALFDQIATVFRGTVQADTIYFYQAMSYFKQSDYILSGHYFRTLAETFGASPFAEQADFMGAYCYYLTSPRPELDQSNTIEALQSIQLFLIKYPKSSRIDECKGYVDELRNKLVEKSYLSAKLYFDLDDYKASMVALNNSLIQYPESKYREDIMYMLVKSAYNYAKGSITSKQKERYQDAVDEYYSFATEYPDSKYIKEAKRYYSLASDFLGGDTEKTENLK